MIITMLTLPFLPVAQGWLAARRAAARRPPPCRAKRKTSTQQQQQQPPHQLTTTTTTSRPREVAANSRPVGVAALLVLARGGGARRQGKKKQGRAGNGWLAGLVINQPMTWRPQQQQAPVRAVVRARVRLLLALKLPVASEQVGAGRQAVTGPPTSTGWTDGYQLGGGGHPRQLQVMTDCVCCGGGGAIVRVTVSSSSKPSMSSQNYEDNESEVARLYEGRPHVSPSAWLAARWLAGLAA